MLDDFLFIGNLDLLDCYNVFMVFYFLVDNIYLLIKYVKIVFFCIILIFLGLEIDIIKFEIRLF